jgi:phenylalanyl-tRNA synthetase alpha subunit
MSAPNKNYDPVEVTALTADEVERATTAALAAISGAQTLDQLKEARIAHAGDKAPLSLARAEIGALPPQARADAGRRVGAATARVRDALKERQEQDTLFVAPPDGSPEGTRSGMVLRTHTSPVQIRSLLTRPLPLYVVSPGKVYRNEALDATHLPVFYQLEGLAVDEGLTMADLRGAIQAFVDALFGAGLRTRLRPDYFPFTEPSADVSMECHVCRGESTKPGADPCRVCRSQGWIEIAGCGMVNPRVLVACGIDPDRYSGFAFGLGIERSLMIGHGLTEIRDAVEGDVRFSRAFGMEI